MKAALFLIPFFLIAGTALAQTSTQQIRGDWQLKNVSCFDGSKPSFNPFSRVNAVSPLKITISEK